MNRFAGKSALDNIAIGPVFIIDESVMSTEKKNISDVGLEITRVLISIKKSREQLTELSEEAEKNVGSNAAAIFNIHKMLLEDLEFVDTIRKSIREERINAEAAIAYACKKYSESLKESRDEYMQARSADIKDISERLIRNLSTEDTDSKEPEFAGPKVPSIIVTTDLSPSLTLKLDRKMVLGIVMSEGSTTSHAVLLAQGMSIPVLVGTNIDTSSLESGVTGILDGINGEFIYEPDAAVLASSAVKLAEYRKKLDELIAQSKADNGGTALIPVRANIGAIEDVDNVLESGADGIGLFRSEFLFLDRTTIPDEEEQYEAYRLILEKMEKKSVVIRTLDLGSDKKSALFKDNDEENPALGLRAIRFCLKNPEIFKTQLRALLRASYYGNLSIMLPLITSEDEVDKAKVIYNEVLAELDRKKIEHGTPKFGLMIETPAAVLISDKLAKKADFFSIGTNDLTQYALAIDRNDARLDVFVDTHHEAILKMIEMTAKSAHKAKIKVGICGALAADIDLIPEFIKMGIDDLSVSPALLPAIKKAVRDAFT